MEYKIALAGNPNCGKTTMFNDLTGSSQYVGNWPGVTVEKKEGKLKANKQAIIQDLPGIYSLSPYTLEEVVTRNYLVNEHPDSMINIIDASNLERNLYLTTQLLEIGVPMVIALNMMDMVRKNGDRIDVKKLSDALGCQIIETSAVKGEGSTEVAKAALNLAQSKAAAPKPLKFNDKLENILARIARLLQGACQPQNLRWYSIKLFERDEKAIEQLKLSPAALEEIEGLRQEAEKEFDDDVESIITHERYVVIADLLKTCYRKQSKQKLTTSDKIDKIVTNRILALPIFAVVMFVIYYLSITTVGTMMTDWVNDVLFGEIIPPAVEGLLVSVGAADWLQSLILDGIVAGVGAVLGFLPQMLVLFLLLALLEDCGYMSRIAFIMDRIFRRFGLSGKSFIPMLIGLGCGVPAVQASRTIENDRDRKMTIMTTTFIPCSAKLPIIGLIAGALFNESGWIATSAYFVGIAAIIISCPRLLSGSCPALTSSCRWSTPAIPSWPPLAASSHRSLRLLAGATGKLPSAPSPAWLQRRTWSLSWASCTALPRWRKTATRCGVSLHRTSPPFPPTPSWSLTCCAHRVLRPSAPSTERWAARSGPGSPSAISASSLTSFRSSSISLAPGLQPASLAWAPS